MFGTYFEWKSGNSFIDNWELGSVWSRSTPSHFAMFSRILKKLGNRYCPPCVTFHFCLIAPHIRGPTLSPVYHLAGHIAKYLGQSFPCNGETPGECCFARNFQNSNLRNQYTTNLNEGRHGVIRRLLENRLPLHKLIKMIDQEYQQLLLKSLRATGSPPSEIY